MTWPMPPQLPGEPCAADDPTGLRYDRGDLDQTTTATAGDGWPITGRGITVPDLLCGHLPGECEDPADCAYWRGVALGEYPHPDAYVVNLPPDAPMAADELLEALHRPLVVPAPLVDPALRGAA